MSLKYKKISMKIIFFIIIILTITSPEPIEITDYQYPVQDISENIIKVAIMGTNDLHGEIFPNAFKSPDGSTISSGGATNMYSYIKALRKNWGDYFLWLDGGDQFQGTVEVMLSEGEIMKDFFNYANLNGIAIGNHDFDYGVEKLKEHIKNEKFPTLCANLYDKKQGKYIWEEGMWENVKAYEIYTLGTSPQIKIGVIGLATEETVSFTSTDLSNYLFDNYYEVVKRHTEYLRNVVKVDSVILLTHFGPKCSLEQDEKMKLKMRTKETFQKKCEPEYEVMRLLKKLQNEEIKVDGLIGAHVHDVVHHWISGIPVIESSGAGYFNIMYLPFKINDDGNVTLQNNNIEIEGPVPVCEKIWEDTKNCKFREDKPVSEMRDILFHNNILEEDKELRNAFKFWYGIVQPKIENIIATTTSDISLKNEEETILTNLVNDIGKSVTGSNICFYNLSGLRHSWHKGGITEIDVFKMFPLNNTWVRFEMTGREVVRMFKDLNSDDIYPATGIIQTYLKKDMFYTLREIEIWDGIKRTKIELDKTYKICTTKFLAEGGANMSKVRKWYDLRNSQESPIIRDSVVKYLRRMKIIKKEFFIDPIIPVLTFIEE